jgi:hypothetical protein
MSKVSLSEIMGRKGAEASKSGLSLDDLPEILGEAMPDLPKNAVGRYRLIRSLKARFGPNFRSLPGVMNVMKEFDTHIALEDRIAKIKEIKFPHKGGSRG